MMAAVNSVKNRDAQPAALCTTLHECYFTVPVLLSDGYCRYGSVPHGTSYLFLAVCCLPSTAVGCGPCGTTRIRHVYSHCIFFGTVTEWSSLLSPTHRLIFTGVLTIQKVRLTLTLECGLWSSPYPGGSGDFDF